MADLLPSSPDPSAAEGAEPKVIGVDSDDADDLLSALSSGTARTLLSKLHEEPATASALAEQVDTSLQNIQYHLGKLEEADIVEVVDTCYSEKGREMKVYAPCNGPLVVYAGSEDDTTGLKAALSRLIGGLGALGLASLVVQYLFGGRAGEYAATDRGGGAVSQATETAGQMGAHSVDQATTAAEAAGSSGLLPATLPPGCSSSRAACSSSRSA